MKKLSLFFIALCLSLVPGCGADSAPLPPNTDFFFAEDITEVAYTGSFLFGEAAQAEVKLRITMVSELKSGRVYELRLEETEGLPLERLTLGYFYVQADKIYKMSEFGGSETLAEDAYIVCGESGEDDPLGPKEKGWHRYVMAEGDVRESHAYDNLTETGYYESFVWERDKGLIAYRSGFGAQRDSIEFRLASGTN